MARATFLTAPLTSKLPRATASSAAPRIVVLGNQLFDLTCVNAGTPEEDCWNLIVFP